jgi:hypothetical protein
MSKKSPKPSTPIKPEAIFEQAAFFEYSAGILASKMNDHRNASITLRLQDYVLPTLKPWIVVCAFSLELYLKCLVLLDTGILPKKTHKIRALFEQLPLARQARIRKLHDGAVANDPLVPQMLAAVKAICEAQNTSPMNADSLDFDTILDEVNDSFRAWRYHYEEPHDGGEFNVKHFVNALVDAILEAYKHLRPIRDRIMNAPTVLVH